MEDNMDVRLKLLVLCVSLFACKTAAAFSGYYEWIPPNTNRTSLYCPDFCKSDQNFRPESECCGCKSLPEWEVPAFSGSVGDLDIEYTSRRGYSKIVNLHGNQQRYKLEHKNGFLTRMPDNVCEFDNLIIIDLDNNRFESMSDISCLNDLDTLILTNNKLTSLDNSTFVGLSQLRVLDLAHNDLVHMDPYTISHPTIGMLRMNFSDNHFQTLDFSNMFIMRAFCVMDMSHNQLTDLVNEAGFTIDEDSDEYTDGGMVDLSFNIFETYFDFRSLGVEDITSLGKFKEWGFDLTGAKWDCNCKMVPFLEKIEDLLKHVWRDYYNVTCYTPLHMQNLSIPALTTQKKLDFFVCNLTREEGCPRGCACVEQTSQRRLIVNCESSDLKAMPNLTDLPDIYDIELYLAGNRITEVGSLDYLNRTTVLDLKDNELTHISSGAFKRLEKKAKKVDLSGNSNLNPAKLEFRYIDECVLSLGEQHLRCDCKNEWLRNWMEEKTVVSNGTITKCSKNKLFCQTENGLVPLKEYSWECETSQLILIMSSVLGTLCVMVLISVCFIENFRHELYLFYRYNIRKRGPTENSPFKYDIYICVSDYSNEETKETRQKISWVVEKLRPWLLLKGYKVFLPLIDSDPGSIVNEEIENVMFNSRSYLVILCNDFATASHDNQYTESSILSRCHLEWSTAWKYFRQYEDKRIVIMNFDHIRCRELKKNPQLRAYLRMKYRVDFSNQQKNLTQKTEEFLGPPMPRHRFVVSKPRFSHKFTPKKSARYILEKEETVVKESSPSDIAAVCNVELFPFESVFSNPNLTDWRSARSDCAFGPGKTKFCWEDYDFTANKNV